MVKVASVSLATALAELRDKSKVPVRIGSLSDFMESQGAFETGNLVLDSITGIGGFPRGRITELFGPTGCGKTTSALQTAGKHQQRVKAGSDSGAIMYLDFERSLDPKYCRSLGLDPDDSDTFVYMQPNSFEHGVDTFRELLGKGLIAICIVDSVASMVSEKELDSDSSLITVGSKAKALHLACRQMIPGLSNNGCSLVFLNHQQEKIDTSFVGKQLASRGIKQWVTPGGTAIPYYASMRIQFSQASGNKTEELNELNVTEKRVTSTTVTAVVIKNKGAVPFRQGTMRIRFGRGFSQPYSIYQILMERNIIKKKTGGHYELPADLQPTDGAVPVGEENLVRKIETDTVWADLLLARARVEIEKYNEELRSSYKASDYEDDGEDVDPETGEIYE